MGCFASKPLALPQAMQDSTPMSLRPVGHTVPVPMPPQTVLELPVQVFRVPGHRSRKGSTALTRSTQSQHGSTCLRVESAPQQVPSLSSLGQRNRAKTLSMHSGTNRANRPSPRLPTPGKSYT
jgi:hypothetical protein